MLFDYPVNKMLNQLEADNLLPAILFRTSRKQCDADIVRVSHSQTQILNRSEQEGIKQTVEKIIEIYGVERNVIILHPQYSALIATGVGAHHAGQLLIWRLLLEELMSRGLLRLMIATGTVAAGVDFPARTVVITAHSKRGSEGFRTLSSAEFQQMSGRAGRRGKDNVGFCLIAPGPFSDARVIHEIAGKAAEPLVSAYFASPSTVLNLLKYRTVDDLKYTVDRSLAAFLDRKHGLDIRKEVDEVKTLLSSEGSIHKEREKKLTKKIRRLEREIQELEGRQNHELNITLLGLSTLGYVENGRLTEKGTWAANLCTSLVLELGQAIDMFLFSDLTLEELVGLVASIAGDSHRNYLKIKQNPIKGSYFETLSKIVSDVKKVYDNPQTDEVQVISDAAVTVLAWLEAESWPEYAGLLALGGVSDGDAARLIMQTADHLGQISRLHDTHPDISRLAAEGRRKLLKPPLSDSMLVE